VCALAGLRHLAKHERSDTGWRAQCGGAVAESSVRASPSEANTCWCSVVAGTQSRRNLLLATRSTLTPLLQSFLGDRLVLCGLRGRRNGATSASRTSRTAVTAVAADAVASSAGTPVKSTSMLVVGATGTLGRQVRARCPGALCLWLPACDTLFPRHLPLRACFTASRSCAERWTRATTCAASSDRDSRPQTSCATGAQPQFRCAQRPRPESTKSG